MIWNVVLLLISAGLFCVNYHIALTARPEIERLIVSGYFPLLMVIALRKSIK